MNLPEQFNEHIRRTQLLPSPQEAGRFPLLLAVSGGLDSVVLCELVHRTGYIFSMAHCNFQLRGEESMRDEHFVRTLGEKYSVPVYIRRFDTKEYAATHACSVQEAARDLRYSWFAELMKQAVQPPLHFLLTAHHADDNAETVLMNFCRGTGLHGLTGIPVKNDFIRRPLLPFSREQLSAFARQKNLAYVEDSSNLSSRYTRNYFRNEIMPAIRKVYPQLTDNLQDNIKRFTEIENLYKLAVSGIKKKLLKQKGNEWHIPIRQLLGFGNRALVFELIATFGFSEKQVDEMLRLAQSENSSFIDSPRLPWRIIRHRYWFIIAPVQTETSGFILIGPEDNEVLYENGLLRAEKMNGGVISHATDTASLDVAEISYPLLLRKWKPGDYFYPLGMKKKKKKVARFLLDHRLSKTEKEKIWVLESAHRICWVLGHRIDERFKITATTKQTLRLSLY